MERIPQNNFEEEGGEEQFPEDLFESKNIVVLGEAHGECDEEIMSFLDKFGSQIDRVFIELPVDYQSSIDTYYETGMVDEILEAHFIGAKKEGKNIRGLLEIIDKLKELGKEVRVFDSAKIPNEEYSTRSERGAYYLRGTSRDEDMFENIRRSYEQNPGNYLLIIGSNHIKQDEDEQNDHDDNLGMRLQENFGDKYASFEIGKKEE